MEQTDGFRNLMGMPGSREESLSVLRPYGVFGIIAPFNFPLALAAGPTAAALLAGNTVVVQAGRGHAALGHPVRGDRRRGTCRRASSTS